jgi:hypothetical protein
MRFAHQGRVLSVAASLILWVVGEFSARAQPPEQEGVVDADERAFVIHAALETLRESYVHEALARQMEAVVRARQAAGEYDRFTGATRFAQAITQDLRAVSHDKHLLVAYSGPTEAAPQTFLPTVAPHGNETRPPPSRHPHQACSFDNVATLAGNVGYLKFNTFGAPALCADITSAAMTLVADVDALIVDLRDNTGGDLAMVAFMSSYFFAKPFHLSNVYERRRNVTYEVWTLPFVPGPRFIDKALFILTSPRAFSAAEAFAYDLQTSKRAVVIGESSGGGAHPSEAFPINEHFQITVPIAEFIDPVSGTNWESRGVAPDIRVTERVVVQVAYRAALAEIMRTLLSPPERDAAQRAIDNLTTVIDTESRKASPK